jgi:gamma-glutamyl phosphate reductase
MSLSAETIAQTAKAAFEASQLVSTTERTRALHEIRKELEANKDSILRANGEDMAVRCALSHFHTHISKKLEVVGSFPLQRPGGVSPRS